MKLKILPPTLREKKRYVGLKIYSQEKLQKEDFAYIVWNGIINLYGEIEASKINPWVVKSKRIPNDNRYQYNLIVKCQRNYEEKLMTALASTYRYRKIRIMIESVGTSGTIKSLSKKYNLP